MTLETIADNILYDAYKFIRDKQYYINPDSVYDINDINEFDKPKILNLVPKILNNDKYDNINEGDKKYILSIITRKIDDILNYNEYFKKYGDFVRKIIDENYENKNINEIHDIAFKKSGLSKLKYNIEIKPIINNIYNELTDKIKENKLKDAKDKKLILKIINENINDLKTVSGNKYEQRGKTNFYNTTLVNKLKSFNKNIDEKYLLDNYDEIYEYYLKKFNEKRDEIPKKNEQLNFVIKVKNITPDYNASEIDRILRSKIQDYQNGKIKTLPQDIKNNKEDYERFYNWIKVYFEKSGKSLAHWWNLYIDLVNEIKPKPPKEIFIPKTKTVLPSLEGEELKKLEVKGLKKKQIQKPIEQIPQTIPENFKLNYPYKSNNKKSKFLQLNPTAEISNKIQDYNIKNIKKEFSKPTYSPYPYTYEMDFMQLGKNNPLYYLFLINVNTRFLIVVPSKTKNENDTYEILNDVIKKYRIDMLKFDGESSFNKSIAVKELLRKNGIKVYASSSPYTYHNKIIDAVIRTIRNLFGPNSEQLLKQPDLMTEMVYYYNNSYHRMIKMTPIEMMNDIAKEWEYIRKMDEITYEIKNKMTILQPGTIVMVYLENGKTSKKFKKRRRNFDDVGEVVGFKNGNYLLKMLTSLKNQIIEVPQFSIKFLANDYEEMTKNKNIIETFNLNLKA